jgi:hypothetical protein
MANPIDFNAAKAKVISLLQASRSPYGTAIDGSKRQFASDAEIGEAILYADAELCILIIGTLGHPYIPNFTQTSDILAPGSLIPAHNGMIINVLASHEEPTDVTGVNTNNNTLNTSTEHKYFTGEKVRVSISGYGLLAGTDYFVIRSSSTRVGFATNPYNAWNNIAVVLSATPAPEATMQVLPQYQQTIQGKSADEVREIYRQSGMYENESLYFWFIEGNVLLSTSPKNRIVYTDFTKASVPQAPEPYMDAVVAGAIGNLLKDGGDGDQSAYYLQIFEKAKGEAAAGASAVPAIAMYKG